MIRTLVIVESCFGTTNTLAEALAAGLREAGAQAEVLPVSQAGTGLPAGLDLLVLAAPTHNRGLPTPASRAQASKKGARSTAETGLREWLGTVVIPEATRVVALDTVTGRGWMNGSAAKAAAKVLSRTHGRRGIVTRSFLVTGSPVRLAEGQSQEARAWGRELVAAGGVGQ